MLIINIANGWLLKNTKNFQQNQPPQLDIFPEIFLLGMRWPSGMVACSSERIRWILLLLQVFSEDHPWLGWGDGNLGVSPTPICPFFWDAMRFSNSTTFHHQNKPWQKRPAVWLVRKVLFKKKRLVTSNVTLKNLLFEVGYIVIHYDVITLQVKNSRWSGQRSYHPTHMAMMDISTSHPWMVALKP